MCSRSNCVRLHLLEQARGVEPAEDAEAPELGRVVPLGDRPLQVRAEHPPRQRTALLLGDRAGERRHHPLGRLAGARQDQLDRAGPRGRRSAPRRTGTRPAARRNDRPGPDRYRAGTGPPASVVADGPSPGLGDRDAAIAVPWPVDHPAGEGPRAGGRDGRQRRRFALRSATQSDIVGANPSARTTGPVGRPGLEPGRRLERAICRRADRPAVKPDDLGDHISRPPAA